MSQETYTFACPVCAVRLSVPKALAGVRGPCPQCHHEITAPEPEVVLSPAMAGPAALEPAVPAPPPRSEPPPIHHPPAISARQAPSAEPPALPTAAPEPEGAAPPPLPVPPLSVPLPSVPPLPELPLARPVAAGLGGAPPLPVPGPVPVPVPVPAPAPVVEVPAAVAPGLDDPFAEIEAVAEAGGHEHPPPSGAPAPPRPAAVAAAPAPKRSGLGLAFVFLLVLGLVAAAGLNLLPRHSLRSLLGQVLPASAVDAVAGPGEIAPPVEPAAGPEAGLLTMPSTIEVRPALTPPGPEAGAAPVTPAAAAPGDPPPAVIDPAVIDPAVAVPATPALEGSGVPSPEPAEPAEPGGAAAIPSRPPVPVVSDGGPPSLLPDLTRAEAPPTAEPVLNEAQAGAQEALTLFLQAKTWSDRLALSDGGERLRGEMEAYYRKVKDGPNPPTSLEFIASAPLADGVSTVQVFHVTFADLPQGFPLSVRQTEEGWKIDWQSFVEFREGRLKKFLAQSQPAPEVFRVRLQIADYQDRSVPNAENKHCFRIAAPIDGHEGYVFVDKDDSIVGPKIASMLDPNVFHHVMVKLKWVRGAGGRGYVELRDIVSESWRAEP